MAEAAEVEAGPSGWHSVSLRIPFLNESHAEIARRALDVDREQNGTFVNRTLTTEGEILIVEYSASTVRLLRLSTNSFLSSVDLVMRSMEAFAPDPSVPKLTDDQLDDIRIKANSTTGGPNAAKSTGIELRGDGKGAGSGEEVK